LMSFSLTTAVKSSGVVRLNVHSAEIECLCKVAKILQQRCASRTNVESLIFENNPHGDLVFRAVSYPEQLPTISLLLTVGTSGWAL
jgi:hypothetical protein